MYVNKLPNADSSMITVDNTAQNLQDLIIAAGSADYKIGKLNAIDILPEDGDIRIYFDGNTPTAAKGILLKSGGYYAFRGVPLTKMSLIRVSGDVSCSIQVGASEDDESTAIGLPSNFSGSLNVDTEFGLATEGGAAAGTGPQVMGRYDATTPTAVDDGDAVALLTDSVGRLRTIEQGGAVAGPGNPSVDSYSHLAINLTTGADQLLVSSAADKQIWIYGYGFTCGDADGQSVSLQDEDDTAVTGIMEFSQYGGISVSPSGNFAMPIHKLGTDKDLQVDILGGDVDGWIAYAIVDVS